MKLEKKKMLAAKTLGVGKDRIMFNRERLAEIKEAITKQDIRDLLNDGAISIKPIKGRKAIVRRSIRRRQGSVRKKVKQTKKRYVQITRKLRGYLAELRKQEKITDDHFHQLRREIRASLFKSKAHMKERMVQKT